jgi:TRAP-type C4-dicarboxylate transport system substrate-binding protein
VALQWHTTGLKHVTKDAHGMLMGALVMNKTTFDKLTPDIQKEVIKLAQRNSELENVRTRRSDQGALRRLIERGYTANAFTPEGQKAFENAFASVRKRLTQRLYPAPLIGRVMELAQAARH